MTTIPLGFTRAVFNALCDVATREGAPLKDAWERLTHRLNAEEARLLPSAIDTALPLFQSDPDRLRIVVGLVVAFDLYEAAPALVSMAMQTRDPAVALAAASLVANPGSDPMLESQLTQVAERIDFTEGERAAFELRLSPHATPASDREADLASALWPGRVDKDLRRGVPPLVAIDTGSAPMPLGMGILGDLYAAGATLRRIPGEFRRRPYPEWLGTDTAIVAWSGTALQRLSELGLRVDSGHLVVADERMTLLNRMRLLQDINRLLPQHSQMRLEHPGFEDAEINPVDQELLLLGAHDIHEVAFLSGGTSSTVYRLAKKEILLPRRLRSVNYWRFSQVVALRAWQFLRARTRRRLKHTIITRLEEFSGAPTVTSVGVTADGRVLSRRGADWVDVDSGQHVFEEVISLDEVFQPFEIGGGRVPALLRPSTSTRVNPAVMGGTPVVAGHRIPARSLALAWNRHGGEATRAAYPDVNEGHLLDAVRTGQLILAR